ncbi:cingulin-like [Tigriopus californicus]|uniref:cingulin-like n=1 Tax=Tigriopus californicus TaxID=6832 RepID=UPI0027DA9F1E|nr:cingulin-like [Tigriopus californicus]
MQKNMEDPQNQSSAYSSLANSTTEINEKSTSPIMKTTPSSRQSLVTTSLTLGPSGEKCAVQIRKITDDYNALLKRATSEIKTLTMGKYELQDQCEKLLTVNEELAGELTRLIRQETDLKAENGDVIRANAELFDEVQRLTDEESRWSEERSQFEAEIAALKTQIGEIEAKMSAGDTEAEANAKATIEEVKTRHRKQLEDYQLELKMLLQHNKELEEEVNTLATSVHKLESEQENLMQKKEKISGENLQLMVEVDEQSKRFRAKSQDLQTQLSKFEEKCLVLEQENARLKSSMADRSTSSVNSGQLTTQQEKRLETLVEKNKNLTEWREQLIEKNKALTEENTKLKAKCTNLEDLLNEEETDINDILELIKKMQVGSPNATTAVLQGAKIGPISKFRDLQFK